MRVLFTTFAAPSHLNLMVPLAWALRCAGHEVRVASQPNLAPAITEAGLTAVPVGLELDMAAHVRATGRIPGGRSVLDLAETRPDRLDWHYVRGALALYSTGVSAFLADDRMLAELVDFARSWRPDLVVWDAFTFPGAIAARACGAAHARFLFGPDHFGRMRARLRELAGQRAPEERDDPMAAWLAARAGRFGCSFDEELALGQLTLDPMPAWTHEVATANRAGLRFLPYGGALECPQWIRQPPPRPRVCLTLGLAALAYGLPTPPVAEILAGLGRLDVEVVATLDREQVPGPVPDNVRLSGPVSLPDLLPTCSAVVHHFGVGTIGAAMTYGVPQLRVPDGVNVWGEAELTRRLVDRGIALAVEPAEFSPAAVAERVTRLLREPAFRQSAEQVRGELAGTPSPHDLVPRLEELAARRRPGPAPAPALRYGPAAARVYDLVHRHRGRDRAAEARQVLRLARSRLPSASSLLDVACGTGAHLRTFGEECAEVHGLDLSPAMLAHAGRVPGVTVHTGDMRAFDLGRTFDVVCCMFASVAYLRDTGELAAALASMARHLSPGGVLVLEPWCFPERFIDGYVGADLCQEEDLTVVRVSHSARTGDQVDMRVRFVTADAGGLTEFAEVHTMTLFSRAEYTEALTAADCTAEYLEDGMPGSTCGVFLGVRK
ncbi:activator-dependent family glycosyltransferase [Crossiella sp. SN42]|uniref:activator-dependent family glycosyltransferase n=1 Tax=Crossiella sp. SN42 TaxID=2944808 RepID=UPI00207C3FA6|nr:activator-dependent family glycosyltransferase [Crossiella sp. SN42]MCO1574615.1 activator-dependent family glycosyltransferase [Crossiella sp. SN42]